MQYRNVGLYILRVTHFYGDLTSWCDDRLKFRLKFKHTGFPYTLKHSNGLLMITVAIIIRRQILSVKALKRAI